MKTGRTAVQSLMVAGVLPLLLGMDLLQRANPTIETANAQMKAGKAEDALANYDKVVTGLPQEPAAHFDRGTALFSLSRFDEAAQEFLRATETKQPAIKSGAFYNLGNALFRQDKFTEAAQAYKRTLALDPGDVRAKWNLELALKKKKDEDKKKQDKQDQKDGENKDKSKDGGKGKDDKKKEDEKKDRDKKDEDKESDQQKEKSQDQKKPEEQKQDDQKPGELKNTGPSEIDAVLNSLERSPKDLEKELARLRAIRRQPPTKDW